MTETVDDKEPVIDTNNDITDSSNDNNDNTKPIDDIEALPKPFSEILKTIEEKVEEKVEEKPESIPKKKGREKEKERVTCQDCGKELSAHVLKYDHKKFCKAVKIPEPTPEKTPEPIPEPIPEKTPEPIPEPPGLVKQKSVTVKPKPKPKPKPTPTKPVIIQPETPIQVTHEMVAEYVKNERVAKATRQRQQYSKLASTGLP